MNTISGINIHSFIIGSPALFCGSFSLYLYYYALKVYILLVWEGTVSLRWEVCLSVGRSVSQLVSQLVNQSVSQKRKEKNVFW